MNNRNFTINFDSTRNEGVNWEFDISGYDMGRYYKGTVSKGFDGLMKSDLLDQSKPTAVSQLCAKFIKTQLQRHISDK